jgi:tetratricopeptide (TPR) repeat protein
LASADRPYVNLAELTAYAGKPGIARNWMRAYEALDDPRQLASPLRHVANGAIALAEELAEEAIAHFRRYYDEGIECTVCAIPRLADAYDRAGDRDSARVIYERYVTTPSIDRLRADPDYLPPSYKRLGELYEERGDREQAIHYYNEFVELWQDADEELQPQVREIRERLARLVGDQSER